MLIRRGWFESAIEISPGGSRKMARSILDSSGANFKYSKTRTRGVEIFKIGDELNSWVILNLFELKVQLDEFGLVWLRMSRGMCQYELDSK